MADENLNKLKNKKLGKLSLSKGTLKLGAGSTLSAKKPSSNSSKVIVITKNRSNSPSELTKDEQQDRVEALRRADAFKTEQPLSSDKKFKNLNSVKKEESEIKPEDIKAEEEPNIALEETQEEVKPREEKASTFKMPTTRTIRNLDAISKKKEEVTKEEPEQKIAEPIKDDKHANKVRHKHEVERVVEKEKEPAVKVHSFEKKRAKNKLSPTQIMMMEDSDDFDRNSYRRKSKKKRKADVSTSPQEKVFREVVITDVMTVQELASRMSEKVGAVIKSLMNLGVTATINQTIDADTAELVVAEFGHKFSRLTFEEMEKNLINKLINPNSKKEKRAPVVTVMGHVDHGKTSLLDALREANVVSGEKGGITQHIGAYMIHKPKGEEITFLDTPGHEAFTAMRLRGAQATDIVILVVAADDGIKPQTVEAINHAKAANVPIIVAINKIDKPSINIEKVKGELLSYEIIPEDLGGDCMVVEVSAKSKINLDKLREAILLQAEVMDLKAPYDCKASGVIIESKVDLGKGNVATFLVQNGTLKVGDIVVAGSTFGKVRALHDDMGKSLKEAMPSYPVEVLGLNSTPEAGDAFDAVESEKIAREICELRNQHEKYKKLLQEKKKTVDSLFSGINEDKKVLNVILKADVRGSQEAIETSLHKFNNDEVEIRILHRGVGGITESDVSLAQASNAIILGFNVRANAKAREEVRKEKVNMQYFGIIYELLDHVKMLLSGLMSPDISEKITGYVDIREVFNITKAGKVAGCYVTEGFITRNSHVRLLRNDVVVYTGKLKALKRFKDDVKEVKDNYECGLSFDNFDDIKVGDKVEAYEIIETAREL